MSATIAIASTSSAAARPSASAKATEARAMSTVPPIDHRWQPAGQTEAFEPLATARKSSGCGKKQ